MDWLDLHGTESVVQDRNTWKRLSWEFSQHQQPNYYSKDGTSRERQKICKLKGYDRLTGGLQQCNFPILVANYSFGFYILNTGGPKKSDLISNVPQ